MLSLNDPAIWIKDMFTQAGLSYSQFTRLTHLAPALVIRFIAGWALKAYPFWLIVILKGFKLRLFQQPTGEDLQFMSIQKHN